MLEEQGIVSAVSPCLPDNETNAPLQYQISIDIQPSNGCGSCSAQQGCGTSNILRFFSQRQQPKVHVLHSESLDIGQTVRVGLSEKAMLYSALIVYFMPLICLFIFAFGAQALGVQNDIWLSVSGILGLIIGILLSRIIAYSLNPIAAYQPVILDIS